MAAAAEAVALLEALRGQVAAVTEHGRGLLQRVRAGRLRTEKGLSVLEVRAQALLWYLQDLGLLLAGKARGRGLGTLPALPRLLETRVVLEKLRPIELRVAYQVQKLLRAGERGDNDPLRFRPSPANMAAPGEGEEEEEEEGGGGAKAPGLGGGRRYVPPRLVPVQYGQLGLPRPISSSCFPFPPSRERDFPCPGPPFPVSPFPRSVFPPSPLPRPTISYFRLPGALFPPSHIPRFPFSLPKSFVFYFPFCRSPFPLSRVPHFPFPSPRGPSFPFPTPPFPISRCSRPPFPVSFFPGSLFPLRFLFICYFLFSTFLIFISFVRYFAFPPPSCSRSVTSFSRHLYFPSPAAPIPRFPFLFPFPHPLLPVSPLPERPLPPSGFPHFLLPVSCCPSRTRGRCSGRRGGAGAGGAGAGGGAPEGAEQLRHPGAAGGVGRRPPGGGRGRRHAPPRPLEGAAGGVPSGAAAGEPAAAGVAAGVAAAGGGGGRRPGGRHALRRHGAPAGPLPPGGSAPREAAEGAQEGEGMAATAALSPSPTPPVSAVALVKG